MTGHNLKIKIVLIMKNSQFLLLRGNRFQLLAVSSGSRALTGTGCSNAGSTAVLLGLSFLKLRWRLCTSLLPGAFCFLQCASFS